MTITDFQNTLNLFLEEYGMSKNELARRTNVPQSQISDWSNGKGKRFTMNAKRVVDFIVNYRKSPKQPLPENIENAVRNLMDGSNERNKAIEEILVSLTRVVR